MSCIGPEDVYMTEEERAEQEAHDDQAARADRGEYDEQEPD